MLILTLLIACSLSIGGASFSLWDLINNRGLLTPEQKLILYESRIPRTAAILLAGSSTALSGCVLQLLVRNRFVEPSIVGSTEGAGLGLLIGTVYLPLTSVNLKIIISIICAALVSFIYIGLIKKIVKLDIYTVPLVGIILSGIIGSVATTLAYKKQLLTLLSNWMLGDFSPIIAGRYEFLIITVICTFLIWLYANHLTIIGMGNDITTNLGLNYIIWLILGLLLLSVNTAVNVVVVGVLPFLGIVVPNIVNRLMGSNLKHTVIIIALGGAVFVLACDIISRLLIRPFEIPVSITMGVIGAAVFLIMLFRSEHKYAH